MPLNRRYYLVYFQKKTWRFFIIFWGVPRYQKPRQMALPSSRYLCAASWTLPFPFETTASYINLRLIGMMNQTFDAADLTGLFVTGHLGLLGHSSTCT